MAKVKIMFSGDVTQIGKQRTVPDDEAAAMVREGRAVYVAEPATAPAPSGQPAPQPAPKPAPTKP